MRDNPYGPTALPNPQSIRQAMSGPDPRQAGLLGAAWTLGYVARFAAGGARRIAISAPVGPFGIAADSGLVHPVFHVVRGLASLEGGALRAVSTSAEREALALCAGSTALWLANLTPEPRTVEVPPEFLGADLRVLDAAWPSGVADRSMPGALDRAPSRPAPARVALDAYAVAALMMRAAGRNSASRVPAAVAGLRGCIPGTRQAPL
jgi:hypothetical protein